MKCPICMLSLTVMLAACATGPSTAPLPPDLKMIAPEAGLPSATKALAGKWSGQWVSSYGRMDHTLVVEQIDQSNATVVYATGAMVSTQGGGLEPSWRRVEGRIDSDGQLNLSFANGAKVRYQLQGDGMLKGVYDRQGSVSTATMIRAAS